MSSSIGMLSGRLKDPLLVCGVYLILQSVNFIFLLDNNISLYVD